MLRYDDIELQKAYEKGRKDVFTQEEIKAIQYAIALLIDKGSTIFVTKGENGCKYYVPWMDLMEKLEEVKNEG